VAPALGHYARGVALARQGRRADADAETAALRGALDAPALVGKTVMRDDPARNVLAVLDGWPDAARAGLERGIEQEATLNANEPPLLGSGSRLALGDLMLGTRR
jgi:hypothetical protein